MKASDARLSAVAVVFIFPLVLGTNPVRTRVLGDDAPEVILTEDEDVVEQLSAERTGEALSEGIHVGRAYRRAYDVHPRRSE